MIPCEQANSLPTLSFEVSETTTTATNTYTYTILLLPLLLLLPPLLLLLLLWYMIPCEQANSLPTLSFEVSETATTTTTNRRKLKLASS